MLESGVVPLTVLGLLVVALTNCIYKYAVNPLSRIPAAHPLAHWTSLWINFVRWRAVENATLKDAHQRLGPIVCLSHDRKLS